MSIHHYERIDDERAKADDRTMQFYVFMMVFWPTAIVLGLIDFSFVTSYDLRLPMLLLSLLAGWAGIKVYKSKMAKEDDAS